MKYGDRNTRYFHGRVIGRKRRNRILALKGADTAWIEGPGILKAMRADFFSKLYEEDSFYKEFAVSGAFPQLSQSELQSLQKMVSGEEIKVAIYSMCGWKAPGPDGLPAVFYQNNWEHVGGSLISWVKKAFF